VPQPPPNDDAERLGAVLEAYDGLLDSLVEHLEDNMRVLLCFFPSLADRAANPAVRRYQATVEVYRDSVGRIVNLIKHSQGRLRFVMGESDGDRALGYYVEGVVSPGVIGPSPIVHSNGRASFSFNRDLRFHLASVVGVSQALAQAVQQIHPDTFAGDGRDTGPGALLNPVRLVSRLPVIVFPTEGTLPWPYVGLDGAGRGVIEFPSTQGGPMALRRPVTVSASFPSDGVTRSYKVAPV
jgi:hypothetical protein